MSAIVFVESLFANGRVSVSADLKPPANLAEAVLLLDARSRAGLADGAPPLHPEAAQWALLLLYRACQALVYREIPASAIYEALSAPCPGKIAADVVYSADLSLRFLPDFIKLSRGIAEDDPLVEGAINLARQWPLSSVGMRGIDAVDLSAFIDNPSLRRLYADRIIEQGDLSRLTDPPAADAVREALGAYAELSPKIARALEQRS